MLGSKKKPMAAQALSKGKGIDFSVRPTGAGKDFSWFTPTMEDSSLPQGEPAIATDSTGGKMGRVFKTKEEALRAAGIFGGREDEWLDMEDGE